MSDNPDTSGGLFEARLSWTADKSKMRNKFVHSMKNQNKIS